MLFIKSLRNSLFACALFSSAAGATTIVQSSGNSQASVPLGTYQPYVQYGMTPIVYAVEWTDTSDYTNVNVTANLFTPGSPGTVNYELVTAIGPRTSFAADGIVEGTVTTPANPTDVALFQLNLLKAGTYYLVLDSPVANTSWQYNFPFQSNYTMAPGVTFLGDQYSFGTSINTAYTPGSTFQGISYPVEFSVTGTVATPEPATFAIAGLVLASLFIRKRRPA
jgi:hypothetical protein